MTNFIDSARLAASADFSQRLQGAILAYALSVKTESVSINADGSHNQVESKRHNLADQVLSNPSQQAFRFASLVSIDNQVSDAYAGDQSTVSDVLISATVDAAWNSMAGVRSEDSFTPTRSELAMNPGFQRRVYQVCSDLANGVVASAPDTSTEATISQEKVKRLFAVRFQAGKYLSPQFQTNFATNVLSGSTIAALPDYNAITDAMIASRLTELVALFVKGQLELTALGVDSGLLA